MFQSAPPVKGATLSRRHDDWQPSVSIRAPREGGDTVLGRIDPYGNVSIRAPREGGDSFWDLLAAKGDVSIRAPREGGDASYTDCSRPIL